MACLPLPKDSYFLARNSSRLFKRESRRVENRVIQEILLTNPRPYY